jgi:hypothetical protein
VCTACLINKGVCNVFHRHGCMYANWFCLKCRIWAYYTCKMLGTKNTAPLTNACPRLTFNIYVDFPKTSLLYVNMASELHQSVTATRTCYFTAAQTSA